MMEPYLEVLRNFLKQGSNKSIRKCHLKRLLKASLTITVSMKPDQSLDMQVLET